MGEMFIAMTNSARAPTRPHCTCPRVGQRKTQHALAQEETILTNCHLLAPVATGLHFPGWTCQGSIGAHCCWGLPQGNRGHHETDSTPRPLPRNRRDASGHFPGLAIPAWRAHVDAVALLRPPEALGTETGRLHGLYAGGQKSVEAKQTHATRSS